MQPTRSHRFLTLIQSSIATTLRPELQSDVARQTADIIQLTLEELKRRERGTTDVLAAANRAGDVIADDMAALLARHGIEVPLTASSGGQDVTPLDREITRHDAVARRLSRLGSELKRAGADEEAMALLLRAARWEVRLHCEELPQADAGADAAPYVPPDDAALGSAIEVFVRTRHADGERVSVTEFVRVTGGFSKASYLLTLRNARGEEEKLVVRKMGRRPLIAFEACLIDEEFHLLSAVAKTDFPAPKPLWLGVGVPGTDSDFYVMTRLPGRTIGTYLGGAEKLPERYLLDLAELLAKLHNYPLDTFADFIERQGYREVLNDNVSGWYRRRIEAWRRYATETDADCHLPSPTMTWLLAWLETHVPQDERKPVLLHGDYNIHNFLAVDDRVTGVLDWENAMFGAPEQDLAYLRQHIDKHIDWNRFVRHYRDSGGREVDEAAFDFYLAFNAMRITFGSNRAVWNLQSGEMSDIRLAAIEFGFLPDFMRTSLQRAIAYESKSKSMG